MAIDEGKIYKNQRLEIRLKTETNLSDEDVSTVEIKYIKPNKSQISGIWEGELHDANEGIAKYITRHGDLNAVGIWKVWVFVTLTNGDILPGESDIFEVHEEGS